MARATHTCNDVYQVENKVKFLTAEALRGVSSRIFDAQGSRLANEWGRRDYVTGTALEQGCDLDKAVVVPRQAPMVQTVLKAQRLSSRSSSTAQRQNPSKSNALRRPRRSWRFLSCSTQSRGSMTLLSVQKKAQMPLVQFIEKLVDDTVLRRTSSRSPSPIATSRDASDSGSGNSTEW